MNNVNRIVIIVLKDNVSNVNKVHYCRMVHVLMLVLMDSIRGINYVYNVILDV